MKIRHVECFNCRALNISVGGGYRATHNIFIKVSSDDFINKHSMGDIIFVNQEYN